MLSGRLECSTLIALPVNPNQYEKVNSTCYTILLYPLFYALYFVVFKHLVGSGGEFGSLNVYRLGQEVENQETYLYICTLQAYTHVPSL